MAQLLVVHDCSAAAALGAAAFTRVVRKSGHDVEVWFDPGITGRTAKFWDEGIRSLLDRATADTALVLFGITFYDRDPRLCLAQIDQLRGAYHSLSIWTHRFPDGYRACGLEVQIPPDDLIYNDPSHPVLGRVGRHLDGYDKQLLTASLLAARAMPAKGFIEEDDLAARVDRGLAADPHATWDLLVAGGANDIAAVHATDAEDSAQLLRVDQAYQTETNTIQVTIPKSASHRLAPAITEHARQSGIPNGAVYVCWVRNDDSDVHERFVLKRFDESHTFPSLRWLIENRYEHAVPEPLRGRHFGPQDVVYFSMPDGATRASLTYDVAELTGELAQQHTGGRLLTAALTRDVAAVGDAILRSIDMTGAYTTGASPTIRIDEESIYVLLHRSSRTNRRRATLTVPIAAHGPNAVAFLFRENGYNLQKLERALEGALIGLRRRSLTWMQPEGHGEADSYLPTRVRLDVRPQADAAERNASFAAKVRKALDADRMTTIKKSMGEVQEDSVIGRVLAKAHLDKLVCYNETETIGPSVAHALALLSTATVAAGGLTGRERQLPGMHRSNVLDLFAGSGIANRILSAEKHSVTSVDKFVPGSAVGLRTGSDGLWLRADARDVLDESNPILDQRFDLIGLDPPHAELMDVLFSGRTRQSLVSACAGKSDLLVLYQGHTTQSGRLALLEAGLQGAGFPNVAVLQIEEELVVLAATKALNGHFDHFVAQVTAELNVVIGRWQLAPMTVLRLAPSRPT